MNSDSKILINLESLLALGVKLNETSDEKSILNMALLSLMGKLRLFRGTVFLPDSANEYFMPVISKGKINITKIKVFEIKKICRIAEDLIVEELTRSGYEICIPIVYREELFAIICMGKKFDSSEMSDEEYYYASLVSSIAANALNNSKNINLLLKEKNLVETRNQLLTTLFEVSRDFNVFLSEEKIIKTLSLNLLGQLMITKFAVIYVDEKSAKGDKTNEKSENFAETNKSDEKLKVLKSTFREVPVMNLMTEFFVCQETCFTEELIVSNELENWIRRNEVWVVSPMKMQSVTKGFLLIGRSSVGRLFTDENLLFIKVMGNTTVLALENLKLIQKEVERQKLENELSLALEIQNRLLPKKNPTIKGYDIYGITKPSKFVGGDYYDFINLPNGNLLIAIADVSGKGMPAALLMANVQAALRVLAPLGLPLNELLFRLNNLVFQNTSADRFVTFFVGELNTETGTFTFINAGHNPPILLKSDSQIELLTSGGIILGVLENADNYKAGLVNLNKNDLIVLYTDGVTEAIDNDHIDYGEKRLVQIIKFNKLTNPEQIVNQIMNDLRQHTKTQPQYDDITLVVLKSG